MFLHLYEPVLNFYIQILFCPLDNLYLVKVLNKNLKELSYYVEQKINSFPFIKIVSNFDIISF